jgi:hypothetical protein
MADNIKDDLADNEENKIITNVALLQGFLAYPRESLDLELKGWLDISNKKDSNCEVNRANIGKALLALANHGGGRLIIGFKEVSGNNQWEHCSHRPSELSHYNQDAINSIVARYAEPVFHCEVYFVEHPDTNLPHPIIEVPSNLKQPVRSNSEDPERKHIQINKYYIRRQGPKSDEPRTAHEWESLINRCLKAGRDDMLDDFRQIMRGISNGIRCIYSVPNGSANIDLIDHTENSPTNGEPNFLLSTGQFATKESFQELESFQEFFDLAETRWKALVEETFGDESPSRFAHGIWTAAYQIHQMLPNFSASEFLEFLSNAYLPVTGWPMWYTGFIYEDKPYPFEGLIEAFFGNNPRSIFKDGVHADFWRASPEAKLFIRRGHDDDSSNAKFSPGTAFDLSMPIWRVGECLMHAAKLVTLLGIESTSISFRFQWIGMQGRALKAWTGNRIGMSYDRICNQDKVNSLHTFTSEQINNNLPEVVQVVTKELYEVFEFYQIPYEIIIEELDRMKRRF